MWCNMTFQKWRPSTWLTCENLNFGDKNDVDVPMKNNDQRKTGWSNSMANCRNPFKKSVVNGKSSVYGSLILPGCSIHQMDPETTCDHSAIHNGFEDLGIESGHPAFGNAEQSSSNNRFLWCRDVWRMRKLQWQHHEFKQQGVYTAPWQSRTKHIPTGIRYVLGHITWNGKPKQKQKRVWNL